MLFRSGHTGRSRSPPTIVRRHPDHYLPASINAATKKPRIAHRKISPDTRAANSVARTQGSSMCDPDGKARNGRKYRTRSNRIMSGVPSQRFGTAKSSASISGWLPRPRRAIAESAMCKSIATPAVRNRVSTGGSEWQCASGWRLTTFSCPNHRVVTRHFGHLTRREV